MGSLWKASKVRSESIQVSKRFMFSNSSKLRKWQMDSPALFKLFFLFLLLLILFSWFLFNFIFAKHK